MTPPMLWCTLPDTGGDLGSNDPAVKLFRSQNRAIRVRTAKVLMHRWRYVPLNMILEILDDLHNHRLGAGVERILLKREDRELLDAMVSRLRSPTPFVREVARKALDRQIRLRRITEPDTEQKPLLYQLGLSLPDRLPFQRDCSVDSATA